jgi:RimJ/RimL family protein N-acetyltransferase
MPIRLATAQDANHIAKIQIASWRSAYASIMPATFLNQLNIEQCTGIWHKALSEPSLGITAVSLDELGEPVGVCVYGPSRDKDAQGKSIGELVALNIVPTEWRAGHGSALCHAVLQHAQSHSWRAVTLWVLSGNTRARNFYETFGFAPDGAEKKDTKLVGSVLHEVRYRKIIS